MDQSWADRPRGRGRKGDVALTRRTLLQVPVALASHCAYAQAPRPDPNSPEALTRVAEQVRKRIISLSNYGVFDAITFGLEPAPTGYRLLLRGFASRPSLKDSATRVLNGLEEVESVDNQIEVLPLSRNDENLRLAAYLKIYSHPSLSRYNPSRGAPVYGSPAVWQRARAVGISHDPPPGIHPISIIVKNGEITLLGVVDTEMDKQLAGLLANQVPGAFKVSNLLATVRKPKSK